ncbi:phytanoyl-CoA dioxygenase family protein [Paenibacillus montanisoli]|uniref:Phytanoyl-CoA dioxygenase n=1 Tax=Paenibacillus montanisoli TaxID=2081970 RepID=A0A328TXH8_9BACL|nr:phytanoyl-CoA dioxygenase family protein [Paenibacillus montanisoli]RAP73405.1 phytanoyl-CoA dioxygenase [Paenibacillus montanisoli]
MKAQENEAFEQALKELGVTDDLLTEEEWRSLDEKGFVLFEGLIDEAWAERMRERYEQLMEQEGDKAGLEVHQEAGTRRLSDLANKGEVFDGTYTHPKVLAAVKQILKRPFKVSSMNGRDAEPGSGHQALHADWDYSAPRSQGDPFHVANSIWMLDAFTADNGATRVVPGTHLMQGFPSDYMDDPGAPHPDELIVTGPAGSVIVINSHLWHGGTTNRTGKTRRAIHPYFTAREFPQQMNMRDFIRPSTYDRISPAARYLLDVENGS